MEIPRGGTEVEVLSTGVQENVGLHNHGVLGGGAGHRGYHCPETLRLSLLSSSPPYILSMSLPVVVFPKDVPEPWLD